jgi:hypothetical protein
MLPHPPALDGFWQTLEQSDPHGQTLSIHHVPVEQFVHFLDTNGSCLCGPSMAMYDLYGQGRPTPMVTHHPLEVKYYKDPDDPGLSVGSGGPSPAPTQEGM